MGLLLVSICTLLIWDSYHTYYAVIWVVQHYTHTLFLPYLVTLHSRYLNNSDIDHLPSKGIRASLYVLHLSGTENLKRFEAYESGIQFYNQTYPLLRKATFFYHAHCCQMKDHHYFVPRTSSNGKRNESPPSAGYSTSHDTAKFKREVSTTSNSLSGYVCVNISDGNVVVNTSSVVVFQNISASQFCSSVYCIDSVCGDECSSSFFSGSGITDIYCIQIAPSACLDKFYSADNFSSQVTYNACIVSSSIEIPSPSPTRSPNPCLDPQGWCEYDHANTLHDEDECTTCVALECAPIHCESEYPDLCMCYRKRSAERDKLHYQNLYHRNRRSEVPTNSSELNCTLKITDVICRVRLNTTLDGISSTHVEPSQLFSSPSLQIERASTQSASDITSMLLPMPTPSSTSAPSQDASTECVYEDLEVIGELLLPSGWFYPDPNTKDVICMELSPEPPTSPTPTPDPTCSDPSSIAMLVKGDLTECLPVPDDFNPCEDLLGDSNFLRAAIWFVIIFALLGNGLILFVFIGHTVIIRRTEIRFFPIHFLYANLALADFLMGLYLLTIASVDAHTLGHFSEDDVEWRTGPGCGFAGFCAITSTVVSVYTLVVITSERLYTITNVMHRRQITKLFASVVMVCGWLFGIVMGMLPLVRVNRYDLVAICLPFDTNSTSALTYIVFLLIMTGLAFIYIAISYGIIFYQVILSPTKRKLVRSGGKMKQWKADLRMSVRMFILVITNFLCWFPIALVSLTAAFGVPLQGIDVPTAKIFVVLVFPLNACVNPFLYTLSTKVFKENFLSLMSKCGLFRARAYSAVHSRMFGTPSFSSTGTTETGASRRGSVISQLILYTMHPHRRTSLTSQNIFNSTTNLRRPSQFSTGSNDDGIEPHLMGCRNSALSQSSNEDQYPVAAHNPNYRPASPTKDEKSKPRHVLNSASSLGVLPEVNEVSDLPNSEPMDRDQNNSRFEESTDNEERSHETHAPLYNGNLVNSSIENQRSVAVIVNNIAESSFSHQQIVANILETGDSEERSDTMSVPDDVHIHCHDLDLSTHFNDDQQ